MTEVAIREAPATDSIVARAASGDEVAFARLIAEHHASMARVAYAISGDRDAAADAAQGAWAIAWRRLGTLRDPSTVRAWLVAIAANEARQAVRRRGGHTVLDLAAHDAPSGSDPSERIATLDLARVLRGLSVADRLLLALRFAAGLDSTEIAAQLGISASGARSRLARLIERLRKDLGHD
jgi:RNA polymerase sigma-70 factor (ECF subfamily)